MAKVTITLEDAKDGEGKDGLIVQWDSNEPENEKSIANSYTARFINDLCSAGESVTDLDEKPETSTLN